MATKRLKLSKRSVDAAACPAPGAGELRYWDEELSGFCLRTYASGRKVYAIKYRVGSRQRWAQIGEHGKPWTGLSGARSDALTAEEARREAKFISGTAHGGKDVTADGFRAQATQTVDELIDRYLAEGPATKPAKRESSWKADRGNLKNHVSPLLGKRRVAEVTRSDIARMVHAISAGETAKPVTKTKARGRAHVRGGAGIAGRALMAASSMFTWGIEHGVGTENPCRGVKLAKRAASERFLSLEEAQVLLEQLSAEGVNPKHAAIIRLLLLTGARKTEIAELRWSEVDLERKRLTLPPERTKAGSKTGERRIALNSAAVAVLSGLERVRGKPYVFPADRGPGPVVGLQKTWEKVRRAAKLEGVRLHDLRHSFASFAVADGASLYLVGKALGHADTRTTERYAHLTDDPLQAMAEAAARRMGQSNG